MNGDLLDDVATPLGNGVFFGRCQLLGAMPEQDLVNAVDRVIGVELEHIVQPGLGGDAIQLGDPGQRVDHGGALAATDAAGVQIAAAAGIPVAGAQAAFARARHESLQGRGIDR